MKNAKSPTLRQKKLLKSHGLVPDNWLILGEIGPYLEVVSWAELERCRTTGKKLRTKYIGKE